MTPILIIHGWGSSAKNWSRVRELLENRGYKVFVPDLPGFGGNPPPEKYWSVDDYAKWVKEYCGKNNLSKFFLVGHSFGGGIAVKFTNYFSDMVDALILVAPKLHRQKTVRYYGGLVLAKIGKCFFSNPILFFLRPIARKVLYALIGTKDYYQLELEKINIMKEIFKKVVEEDLIYCLAEISTPVLIIWGKKDQMTPVKDAYLVSKEIKGSKLEVIENGKHALNMENPEILAEKILNFIK